MKKGILLSSALICFVIVFLLVSGEETAHSYSPQPPAFHASAPGQSSCGAGGTGCHSSHALNSGTGSVNISFGGTNTTYMAGQTYNMSVTVAQTGASRFGFELVALNNAGSQVGNFTLTNATNTSLQTSAGMQFVGHKNAPVTNNSQTFTFSWTAPSTGLGNVNFYVSGNASNNNFNTTGDYIYSKKLTISESPQASNFEISAKIYLEAMFANGTMNTKRLQTNLLPLAQPFAAFYGYNGSETVSSFPANTVDWVLVSLKNGSNVVVAQQAALLLSNGTIVPTSGSGMLQFLGIDATKTYTLVVHHQSHLGIASAVAQSSGSNYNFTTAQTQAKGIAQLKLVNGAYAMYSGDFDGNGNINNLDYNLWAGDNALVNQYRSFDADGNAIVNNLDYNSWERNRSKVGDLWITL